MGGGLGGGRGGGRYSSDGPLTVIYRGRVAKYSVGEILKSFAYLNVTYSNFEIGVVNHCTGRQKGSVSECPEQYWVSLEKGSARVDVAAPALFAIC